MLTPSCLLTKWKGGWQDACFLPSDGIRACRNLTSLARRVLIDETSPDFCIHLRLQGQLGGEPNRFSVGHACAIGVHSPVYQIHGRRGVRTGRFLPDAASYASDTRSRPQPHNESRDGSLLGPT